MSSLYRRTGIILKRQNVGSVDRMITLFAADGKHVLRARGTQKLQSKLAGSLEPLTLVELTIARGRASDQVIGSSLRDAYRAIHASLPRIAGASVLVAAADALVRGRHNDPLPYKRLREAFALLARSRTNREVFLAVAYGLWNLLASLGYAPHERDYPASNPARRLAAVLLRGQVKLVRRVRCTVGTARLCTEAALQYTEAQAEQPLVAGTFFRRVLTR